MELELTPVTTLDSSEESVGAPSHDNGNECGDNVVIGDNVAMGDNLVMGDNVVMGDNLDRK